MLNPPLDIDTLSRNELIKMVRYLRARLEIDHMYDADGNRIETSLAQCYDGIACRDAAIHELKRMLDERKICNQSLEET